MHSLYTLYLYALQGAGIVLALDLTRLDLRTGILELGRLRLFVCLGLCVLWAQGFAPVDAVSTISALRVVQILGPRILAMLPIYLLSVTLGGIGGGDLRYLLGLALWLPLNHFYLSLAIASMLHVAMYPIYLLRRSRNPLAPLTPFLPALNLATLAIFLYYAMQT